MILRVLTAKYRSLVTFGLKDNSTLIFLPISASDFAFVYHQTIYKTAVDRWEYLSMPIQEKSLKKKKIFPFCKFHNHSKAGAYRGRLCNKCCRSATTSRRNFIFPSLMTLPPLLPRICLTSIVPSTLIRWVTNFT